MLQPSIPQFRKRRGRAQTIPTPAPSGLLITEVRINNPWQLIVTFSAPITWNGVDVPTAFQSFTDDGFFDSPINVISVGPDWIELEFNGGSPPGTPWQVIGVMAGITPQIAFPQSGTVTP